MPSTHPPEPGDGPFVPEAGTLLIEDQSLRHGFVQLPKAILYARNLSRHAKILYAVLLGYAWQEDRCFPGYGRLCHDLQASENSVRLYMRELQDAGLLRWKRRGLGKTNLYILADIRTSKIEVQEPKPLRTAKSEVLEPQDSQAVEPQELRGELETVEEDSDYKEIVFEHSNVRKVNPGKKGQGSPGTNGNPPSGPEGVGAILARSHTPPKTHPAGKTRGGAASRPETGDEDFQRIQSFIMDRQRELGDRATAKSSSTRAWNLYQAAGCSIARFEEALYKARSLTQESTAQIKAVGDDPNFDVRRKIKMPYFFAVLEDILGLRDAPEKSVSTPKRSRSQAPSNTRERGTTGHSFVPHIET